MNRVDRLKTLITEQFSGSQKEFSKAVGKNPAQISHWLNGVRAIGDGVAAQIETALDLPRGWMDGKESRGDVYLADTAEPRPGFIRIGLMNKPAAAGSSEDDQTELEPLKMIDVSEDWARKKFGNAIKKIRLFWAKGDSMEPTISDGDLLFVNVSKNYYDGEGIYVISSNMGGFRVKRLEVLLTGELSVISDNPKYKPQIIGEENQDIVRIDGSVVARWTLDFM